MMPIRSIFLTGAAAADSYTLSLHDALPILAALGTTLGSTLCGEMARYQAQVSRQIQRSRDRKSTRLNSSHIVISYAVFCLKKKTKYKTLYSLTMHLTGQEDRSLHVSKATIR